MTALLLAAMLAAAPARAAREGRRHVGLYEGRGFVAGRCYAHPAVRRCQGHPLECDLEVFPRRTGSLHFRLDPSKDSLTRGAGSTDFGIFRFEVTAFDSNRQPVVRIVDIRDVPLRKWDSIQDREARARPVPCPETKR